MPVIPQLKMYIGKCYSNNELIIKKAHFWSEKKKKTGLESQPFTQ